MNPINNDYWVLHSKEEVAGRVVGLVELHNVVVAPLVRTQEPHDADLPADLAHVLRLRQGGLAHDFHDLPGRYFIKNVVLFEENSILLLPECLESSGW